MKYQSFTMPAKEVNEDAVYICSKFGFVLDGATGLLKEKITNSGSDANWYTTEFKKYLMQELKDNSRSLKEIVCQGIIEINDKYMSFDGANNVKSKPSSGVAIFRIKNDKLEYFILGDCAFLIRTKNGFVKHVSLEELSVLDKKNINRLSKIAKENNIDVIDAVPLINNFLVETRLTQNTPNGYWILSDNPEAVKHAKTGAYQLDNVVQIIGFSDGFSQLFDVFSVYDTKQFADVLLNGEKPQNLYKTLCNHQNNDAKCNRFPRFKLRDDASLIEAQIE